MREHVATASLIDMEANHLPADGTLCYEGVEPPCSYELYELNNPYGQVPHISLLENAGPTAHLCVKRLMYSEFWAQREPFPSQLNRDGIPRFMPQSPDKTR